MPNGLTSDYDYDNAGRLTLLAHSTLTETIAGYKYDLDRVGNRITLTETLLTLLGNSYPASNGQVVLEAENGERTNGTTHNWLLKTSIPSYTGTSYLETSLDDDTLIHTEVLTTSPRAEYLINVTTPGTYTVWLRGYPANAAGDSAYVGIGQQVVTVTGFTPFTWTWASEPAQLVITQTGLVTTNLWMREDGLRIDRVLLTTDTTFVPTGFGPAENERLTVGNPPPATLLTRTIVYTYDNLYRLTNADYSTSETYAYDYDEVGNRLTQIINGDTTAYQYDAANRLEKLDNQPVYSFDNNGNLENSNTLTNTWDAANRLIASERDGTTVQPIYNGVNDRVGQTVGTTTTNFALDVAAGLPEVIYTSDSDAYLHLPGVIVAESSTGETRYLLSDGLGSVRQAVDDSAAVMAYYEFDPYGNPVNNTGGDPYGYTGEWYVGYINLLHLRARWYSSESGTFLSVDPVESEPAYQYVRGNPVNLVDPSGRTPFPPWDAGNRFMYSCGCGWIDTHHAEAGLAYKILDGLLEEKGTAQFTGSSFYSSSWINVSNQFMKGTVAVYPPAIQEENDLYSVALGIYISAHNISEEFGQGNGPIWQQQSTYSSEDLVSNLIGFHRAIFEIENKYPRKSNASSLYFMKRCGLVGYEFYARGEVDKFKEIQKAIWYDMFLWDAFGSGKSVIPFAAKHIQWGNRPANLEWKGEVEVDCQKFGCNAGGSGLFPSILTSITPREPLDGWAWAPGVEAHYLRRNLSRQSPEMYTFGQDFLQNRYPEYAPGTTLFVNPSTGQYSGGHYFNSLPLNWNAEKFRLGQL